MEGATKGEACARLWRHSQTLIWRCYTEMVGVCGGWGVDGWQLGKKGYVQMQTSVGNLNLEVHADFVPSTAENFLTLCANGAYDGTTFHRCRPQT